MAKKKIGSVAEEVVNVDEVNNNIIDSVDNKRYNLNDEHWKIAEQINKIMPEGKTCDTIMFKKVDKKS